MSNRRKQDRAFAVWLTVIFAVLFIAILSALVFAKLVPESETLIGGWGGSILAILGTAAAYEWGSSKGSAAKDDMAAAAQASAATTTVTVKPPVIPTAPEPKVGE